MPLLITKVREGVSHSFKVDLLGSLAAFTTRTYLTWTSFLKVTHLLSRPVVRKCRIGGIN